MRSKEVDDRLIKADKKGKDWLDRRIKTSNFDLK